MIFNITVGFIIPWIFGIYLFSKYLDIFLIIYPFASVVAFIFNTLGMSLGFWTIVPQRYEHIIALGSNIGLFPILGAYFIIVIHKKKYNLYAILIIFTLITTIIEFIIILLKYASYSQGWNIFHTFLSYLVAYIIGYFFYRFIINKNILQ